MKSIQKYVMTFMYQNSLQHCMYMREPCSVAFKQFAESQAESSLRRVCVYVSCENIASRCEMAIKYIYIWSKKNNTKWNGMEKKNKVNSISIWNIVQQTFKKHSNNPKRNEKSPLLTKLAVAREEKKKPKNGSRSLSPFSNIVCVFLPLSWKYMGTTTERNRKGTNITYTQMIFFSYIIYILFTVNITHLRSIGKWWRKPTQSFHNVASVLNMPLVECWIRGREQFPLPLRKFSRLFFSYNYFVLCMDIYMLARIRQAFLCRTNERTKCQK